MAEDDGQMEFASPAVSLTPTSEQQCLIDYFMQQQLYRSVQRVCEAAFGRGNDDDAHFWHAVALTAEGSATEAIRELDPLQNNPEMALAVNAALINAHRSAKGQDKESIEKLKEKLKKFSRDAEDDALVFAGRYFLHTDKVKQSRQCLEKIYTKNPQQVETLTMLGWLNLQSGQSRQARQALNFFDAAIKLTAERKDIGALLGRSKYYERSAKGDGGAVGGRAAGSNRKKWDRVLDDLNQIIVTYPNFTPAILEKSRVLMLMNQWDESLLQAQRVLKKEPRDVCALRLVVLFHLTRESKGAQVANRLSELMEALESEEPHNHALMYDCAQLVCRLANRKKPILQQTLVLVERACRMEPANSSYLTEQGYQLMLLDDFAQASLCFQEASKLDEGNIQPLAGLIKCKILQGNLREAQQELEFLAEISASIGSNADLTFLHALLAWLKDGDEARCMEHLNSAMMEHAKALEDAPLGYAYFVAYNPDFVLEVVGQYMQHVGTEPAQSGDPPNPVLHQCIRLLRELTEMVPAMLGAQLMLSRANFIAGEFDEAERALALCLRLDPQCAPAHIIQAQICLQRENYQQCSASLEQARSLDFEIRNTPIYHLMKTKLLEASGQVEDALKVLQAAMELPGVRKAKGGGASAAAGLAALNLHNPSASLKGSVPLQDRISIFLELAEVLVRLGQVPEATRVMADARAEFKHTTEATRILIADAELACKRRDFDSALKMLQSVPADNPYATRAKIKCAEIYLHNKKNKKAYAACYHELAHASAAGGGQSVHGFLLLGQAYMQIGEPEKAIKAYEGALKLNPGDAALSSKIGRALVTTHDYKKAVAYYESAAEERVLDDGSLAVPTHTRILLLHDLAELYLSLKQYGDAVRVLETAMAVGAAKKREGLYDEDVAAMTADVRSLSIWADVGQASHDNKVMAESLTAAWTLQVDVLSKLRSENPDAKRHEREVTAVLCYRLAEYYRSVHQLDKALQFYNESLKYNESHDKSRLALARLHLLNSDLDACQQQCVTLMRLDPGNKEASLMLADLMFRKNESEAATFHFQQLLEKNPTRYDALHKLIQLLRRAGRLVDAPRFLKLAEKFSAKATFAPGLHYVKGLYAWYSNDAKTALSEFNQARKDGEWGRLALINMVEIYLNPDNIELFQESADAKGDNAEQVSSAEKLLADLQQLNDPALSLRVAVLESYVQMASKNKARIDSALQSLMALCATDATRDYVPALLAMANAFVLRSEPAKARNQLKRISKMQYDPEWSQEFERSWLMLADIYIQVGKYEFAQELCKKALAVNKSSAKSWEMLGQIMEKEQSYKDAAEHYEHAWNFMHETSPSVGYKLAFNYLKAKRFVEAIDVCHKVLAAFPDYPKIRKDILAKAREALRP